MGRASKFTDEQKLEIALELLSGKVSQSEVCRKYDISTTYAYKLKDRALALLREGLGRPAGKPDAKVDRLQKKVADLEQLAGDQALAIRYLKKCSAPSHRDSRAGRHRAQRAPPGSIVCRAGVDGGALQPAQAAPAPRRRRCPVSGDPSLRARVRALCDMPPDLRVSVYLGTLAA